MRHNDDTGGQFPSGWFILPSVVLGSVVWVAVLWMVVEWLA